MKTYPVPDASGRLHAFEVPNTLFTTRRVAALLRKTPGVADVKVVRRLFSTPSDVRIRFVWRGRKLIVWEPWGDNSRYWIGPDDDSQEVEIDDLKRIFSA
jgi:hypothetical protein